MTSRWNLLLGLVIKCEKGRLDGGSKGGDNESQAGIKSMICRNFLVFCAVVFLIVQLFFVHCNPLFLIKLFKRLHFIYYHKILRMSNKKMPF